MQAKIALAAFGGVQGDNMIAGFYASHASADFDNNSSTFMTQNCWEGALRIVPGEREGISMTNPRGFNFNHDLTRLRALQVYVNNL
jgi:hypothetical protein